MTRPSPPVPDDGLVERVEWRCFHCGAAAKAYYRQTGRHQQQLQAAEKAGYERGLADARAALAASDRDVLLKRIDDAREGLRVMMLEQPITGERRTYNDGFAQGLAHAIGRIDAALVSLGGEGGS